MWEGRRVKLLGRRAECEELDRLLADALAGQSRVVVLRGEAGVGKSALLGYVVRAVSTAGTSRGPSASSRRWSWPTAASTSSAPRCWIASSGCPSRSARRSRRCSGERRPRARPVPGRARHADAVRRGRRASSPSSASSTTRSGSTRPPRRSSASSRAGCSPNGSRSSARSAPAAGDDVLAGLPDLPVRGLGDSDARALLLENMHGPLDAAVCDQIINESHGNPLALLELPRAWSVAERRRRVRAARRRSRSSSKIEESYARRLLLLPPRRSCSSSPRPQSRSAIRCCSTAPPRRSGSSMAAAGPAVDAGLLEVGGRVEFAHPLVRSAAYRSAAADDRHRVHRALAEATDAETDPDRRAWHRARATPRARRGRRRRARALGRPGAGARRHRRRGGVPGARRRRSRPTRLRARRARAGRGAGEASRPARSMPRRRCSPSRTPGRSTSSSARWRSAAGQIAFDLGRGREAPPLLLGAAQRLETLDAELARETYLEALARRALRRPSRGGDDASPRSAEARAPAPFGSTARPETYCSAGLAIRVHGRLRGRRAAAQEGTRCIATKHPRRGGARGRLQRRRAWTCGTTRHGDGSPAQRRARTRNRSARATALALGYLAGHHALARRSLRRGGAPRRADARGLATGSTEAVRTARSSSRPARRGAARWRSSRHRRRAPTHEARARDHRRRARDRRPLQRPRPVRRGAGRARAAGADEISSVVLGLAGAGRGGGAMRRAGRRARRARAPRRSRPARAAPTGRSASRPARARSSPRARPPRALPRGDRASRPVSHRAGPRARPAELRRVAAPGEPARRRPRTAARAHDMLHRDGHEASPSARAASCWRPARRCAGAATKRATSSRRRKSRSPGSPATDTRTRRSARSSSSARAPSSGTCARCSPSSASARARASAPRCREASAKLRSA